MVIVHYPPPPSSTVLRMRREAALSVALNLSSSRGISSRAGGKTTTNMNANTAPSGVMAEIVLDGSLDDDDHEDVDVNNDR